MRIAIDMQGALTAGSRPRGIGRYTSQLVHAMVQQRGDDDLRLVLNANHAAAAEAVAAEYAPLLPRDAISRYRVPVGSDLHLPPAAPERRLGDAIVRRHIAGLQPDVMMATSLFEPAAADFSPLDLSRYPARLSACILYDLVPLLFRDLYLNNPVAELSYRATAASLAQTHLLLAISESARRDAIRLLDLDPGRVVNISGAADGRFGPLQLSSDQAQPLLARLGLERPFVMYVSGADPRKNLSGAVAAFAALPDPLRQSHQLLLVTNLGAGEAEFRQKAEALGLPPQQLVLTSGLDDEALVRLMNLATVFLFPSLYEGFGLPVLEAMQCGTPVLAANTSSIPEIIDRGDLLFDAGDNSGAAAGLARLLGDAALRREISDWGIRRAASFTWQRSARTALDAMRERLAEPPPFHAIPCELLDLDNARTEFGGILAGAPALDERIGAVVDDLLFSVPGFQEGASRRLLIDVSMTQGTDLWSGIQRVVRQVTAAFYEQPLRDGVIPLAVRLEPLAAFSVPDFVAATLDRPPAGLPYQVEIRDGDDLFMLDSSWEHYASFAPVFTEVERQGGRVITCIYDLIPELHPEVCTENMPEVHGRWLANAVRHSHGLICISRAVADELIAYIRNNALSHRPGLRIGWFHCGSNIQRAGTTLPAQPATVQAFAGPQPVFVCVGTLEPRKAQDLALDAFEQLWAQGIDASLCLIGKLGWKVEALAARIRSHPEHGKRLHWLNDARDADVVFAYNHAEAVLCTSLAEGFGLPIAEAARMERPVICSDIPVFREVGGAGAVYFPVGDAAALAGTLRRWLDGERPADPTKVSRNSWADAALRIREVLYEGDWYRRLD
ncbi:glycosyltransferase family 4 protein [Teichococcus vastitatis]|uniref:Glycosyltransferase family 4 protein n=1 Tax=Teichococcus vastitatis TaxID=2307076 RepID=A0ABS9W049_9PROT|nr:glycosyltransferase family 1 protein [Pseudoroseomonas vastitatis]MCI0752671.1 glycosyltransferase family 4 protein [Pseudoroseomonas vastitatis]